MVDGEDNVEGVEGPVEGGGIGFGAGQLARGGFDLKGLGHRPGDGIAQRGKAPGAQVHEQGFVDRSAHLLSVCGGRKSEDEGR